jgi:hypothetical protein
MASSRDGLKAKRKSANFYASMNSPSRWLSSQAWHSATLACAPNVAAGCLSAVVKQAERYFVLRLLFGPCRDFADRSRRGLPQRPGRGRVIALNFRDKKYDLQYHEQGRQWIVVSTRHNFPTIGYLAHLAISRSTVA